MGYEVQSCCHFAFAHFPEAFKDEKLFKRLLDFADEAIKIDKETQAMISRIIHYQEIELELTCERCF